MAEIRVEKKGKPIWPWIVGIFVVIIAAFILLGRDDDGATENPVANSGTERQEGVSGGKVDDRAIKNDSTVYSEPSGTTCVDKFSSLVQRNDRNATNTDQHIYAHEGLKYLSCALEHIIEQNNVHDKDLDEKQNQLIQTSVALQKNMDSEDHLVKLKEALNESADIMASIQSKNYPQLKEQVVELKKAAAALEADKSLEQQENLQEFFEKASEVVTKMEPKNSIPK